MAAQKKKTGSSPVSMTVKRLLAKARSVTGDIEESAALDQINAEESAWQNMQAVLAPYDPRSLLRYIEITPHLKPAIMSMAHNIDGTGYRPVTSEPWMDSTDDEVVLTAIVEALTVEAWVQEREDERAAAAERGELEEKIRQLNEKGATQRTIRKYERRLENVQKQDEPEDPEGETTEESINRRAAEVMATIRERLVQERYLFESWFEQCVSETSFVELRKKVRMDIESHGWGTIEWLRDKWGQLKRLQYIPGFTVRPLQDKGRFIDVPEDDSVTPLSQDREVIVPRRFRLYVQQVGGSKVYFKSPKDPRVVSRTTGKIYPTIDALQAPTDAQKPGEGKDAEPANELMWIAKHDPTTPCPPPDWVGNLLAVLGIREADETNYFYLNSNAIPSALLFVHGGTVPKATKERLESRIKHEIQGAENTGKMLVVEAIPGGSGKAAPGEKTMLPKITFQSLREAHTNDALFVEYDKRGADRIGASFRLSPLLRGYTPSDLNRATAVAALFFAEQQVFAPVRDDFDWRINKQLIPELGLRFIRFKSNTPSTTTTKEMGEFIKAAGPHGAFTPADVRVIAGETMNQELPPIDADWTTRPIQLTLNGITDDNGGGGGPTGNDALDSINARLEHMETNVAQIVTEELRAIGLEHAVTAAFVDGEDVDGEDVDGEDVDGEDPDGADGD